MPLEKLYERDGAIQRKSCSDPIPTCSQPCQRVLKCGVPGSYHECQALCHEGPCPPCPLETPVKCRCGAMDCNVLCSELTTKADEATCKKPCRKVSHYFKCIVTQYCTCYLRNKFLAVLWKMHPNFCINNNLEIMIYIICHSAASLWSPQVQYQMLHRCGSHVFSSVWKTAELRTPQM